MAHANIDDMRAHWEAARRTLPSQPSHRKDEFIAKMKRDVAAIKNRKHRMRMEQLRLDFSSDLGFPERPEDLIRRSRSGPMRAVD